MIATLLVKSVLLPLGLGALLAMTKAHLSRVLPALVALAAFGVIVLIEGLPPFPPVSALHKCLTLLPVLAGLALLGVGDAKGRARGLAIFGFLLVALVWLGWARIADPALLARMAAILPLLAALAFTAARDDSPAAYGFALPGALLVTAAGTALVALVGAHIGGAQVLGAVAALTGGLLLPGFISHARGGNPSLPPPAALAVLAAVIGIFAIQTGLFAPDVPALSLILLALCPLVPALLPQEGPGPRIAAPIVSGLVSALPAAAAILLAAF